TPMQWSPDRNGGFSRADPQRLFLPPIMDPLHDALPIYVEAQHSDRSSLLNWMKRMIAVRKQHPAFGRGTLTFLYPRNRKVLAYLRSYENDIVLCVVNLARSAQAVELDLSEFRGRVPIELLGRSPFPPVGDLPYMLTLPAYGFFWFILAEEAELPGWHEPIPEPLPEFITLVMSGDWKDLLQTGSRRALETDALPMFLPKQRWFAAKNARRIEPRIVWSALFGGSETFRLAEISVAVDGSDARQRYLLPLARAWGEQHIVFGSPLLSYALAKIRRGARVGALYDATQSDRFGPAVIAAMRAGEAVEAPDGQIVFTGTPQLGAIELSPEPSGRRLGVEQSNTSIIVDEQVILKIYRRLQTGIPPEIEVSRFLTEVAGFENAPQYLGAMEYRPQEGPPTALGAAFTVVGNQGDGWTFTVEWLERLLEDEALMRSEGHVEGEQLFADYMALARTLGQRTAELHSALATETDDPAFTVEPVSDEDRVRWVAAAHEQHARARAALASSLTGQPERIAGLARMVLDGEDEISERIDRLASIPTSARKSRIHGDYHLGQVLISHNDFYIIDFEGEPARSVEDRRQKTSPSKVVSGMLQSLTYAAQTSARWASEQTVPSEAAAAMAEDWNRLTSEAFLIAYAEEVAGT